jgi:hypothetical protein
MLTENEPAARTGVTRDEIMAARTPRGAWTKATLAEWGIAWPPQAGWIDRLVAEGRPFRVGDWRPIETAEPKELDRRLVTDGCWIEIAVFLPRKPGDDREGPGWVARHGDVTPTHWQPLVLPNGRTVN